jgi:hypothetical protein
MLSTFISMHSGINPYAWQIQRHPFELNLAFVGSMTMSKNGH